MASSRADTSGRARSSWLDPARICRILIIRTSALGDVLHVLPALEALHQRFPGARIAWLVEPLSAPILGGHPLIDTVHVMDRKRWVRDLRSPRKWGRTFREVTALVAALRRERYDLVIDFQGNIRSGVAVLLSGGHHRLGFDRQDCREWGGWAFTNLKASRSPPLIHKVLKNLHLVRELGWDGECPQPRLSIPPADVDWAREVVDGIEGDGPLVTLHPAVSRFGAFKRWPAEHFRELCELLRDELDARILVTWGPGEREMAAEIGHGTLAPATPELLRLAALVALSDLFVAADTGVLHLATLLGVPVVGLYGPKNPEVYGPHNHRGRVLRNPVPCSPCHLRRCPHRTCMATLFAPEVFAAARDVLRETSPSGSPP